MVIFCTGWSNKALYQIYLTSEPQRGPFHPCWGYRRNEGAEPELTLIMCFIDSPDLSPGRFQSKIGCCFIYFIPRNHTRRWSSPGIGNLAWADRQDTPSKMHKYPRCIIIQSSSNRLAYLPWSIYFALASECSYHQLGITKCHNELWVSTIQ